MKTIKIGDAIWYRPCWGHAALKRAKVEQMDLTAEPRSKYGEPVDEVTAEQVRQNRVLFILSDGHWAYANQIDLGVQT